MDKNEPIFVAGHRGLIGSAVLRRLEREGFKNIFSKVRGDLELTDGRAVEEFFQRHRPRTVVLAAGLVGGIVRNKTYPADMITENLAIQTNTIWAAQQAGVERFVFFASSCMYPRECPQPMKEEQLWTGVPEPTSIAYAAAKTAGVEMCLAYNRQYGKTRFLPVIPNNAYGPNDDFDPESSHVLSALLRRFHEAKEAGKDSVTLWGTGRPRREFIHSDDIADAVLHILDSDLSKLQFPVNIGVGTDHSIKELAEAIRSVVGYAGKIEWDASKPDGAPRKLLDSARLFSTGWKPRVSLEQGLRSTYQWYLKNASEVKI